MHDERSARGQWRERKLRREGRSADKGLFIAGELRASAS
jgi:hypothetical protein